MSGAGALLSCQLFTLLLCVTYLEPGSYFIPIGHLVANHQHL